MNGIVLVFDFYNFVCVVLTLIAPGQKRICAHFYLAAYTQLAVSFSSSLLGYESTYCTHSCVNLIIVHSSILFGLIFQQYPSIPTLVKATVREYESGLENRGNLAPYLDFEILICSEIIGNQLSLAACFMFIAAWIHFLYTFI